MPCEESSLIDLRGHVSSYLKFDISPIYEVEDPIQIVSVKLRLVSSKEREMYLTGSILLL